MLDAGASRSRYESISPIAYRHPADVATTAALQRIPQLDRVVRRFMTVRYEWITRAELMSTGVRLGPSQLPDVWRQHSDIYEILDIEEVPELYLTLAPIPNATASGSFKPIVNINSELFDLVGAECLRAVLAHEAGHIHCDHVLYQQVLNMLRWLSVRGLQRSGVPFAGLALVPLEMALLAWSRAAELSADRAAAIVTRDPDAVCQVLLALAAGTAATRLNLEAFIEQGLEYSSADGIHERTLRGIHTTGSTHPLPVQRVHALMGWIQTGAYDQILQGDYVRRGEEFRSRAEVDEAALRYAQGIDDLANEAEASVIALSDELDRLAP